MNSNAKVLYRPSENHIGVIYRCGRFNRLVNPDQITFLFRPFDTVKLESRLDMRTAQISLRNIYTFEKVAVDVAFKVFYQVDLRQVDADRLIQVLRFPTENAWDEIIRTAVNDISRNLVFISKSFNELNSKEGRATLKQTLSSEVASRVRSFGILINPRYGVNMVDLQPNEEFRQALMQASAAEALGLAAASRLKPLADQFIEQNQEKALIVLLMNIASAVAKNGVIPDVIYPTPNEYLNSDISKGNGKQGSIMTTIQKFPSSDRKPKSLAGD